MQKLLGNDAAIKLLYGVTALPGRPRVKLSWFSLGEDHLQKWTLSQIFSSHTCSPRNLFSFLRKPIMKLLGGISGGSGRLQFFMSQCRKNSARGKVIDKKWFIRIGRLSGLQAGREVSIALSWVLSELRFYNQRKRGEGEKDYLLPHSSSHPSLTPPTCWSGEVFDPIWFIWDCHGAMEKLFQVSI